jgi:hypothetical protein
VPQGRKVCSSAALVVAFQGACRVFKEHRCPSEVKRMAAIPPSGLVKASSLAAWAIEQTVLMPRSSLGSG